MPRIPSEPTNLFAMPFADAGNKTITPEAGSGSGRASLANGFPPETQLPLSQGGVAPNRLDFNGQFYMISAFLHWFQSGGQMSWKSTLNYSVPSIVYHDGVLWWCVANNGPETGAGAKPPSEANNAYWANLFKYLQESEGHGGTSAGFNCREIISTSSTWISPSSPATFKVTVISGGGGGGGADKGLGGSQGGTTSFGSYLSISGGSGGGGGASSNGGGGGGGAGEVDYDYLTLPANTIVPITIGNGGAGGMGRITAGSGGNGEGPTGGRGGVVRDEAGSGAAGASNGCSDPDGSGNGSGGSGGRNQFRYGGGGGGGAGGGSTNVGAAADGASYGSGFNGGAGGKGAVIIEYFKES